jgi:PAS domain S-box-containing protein
LFTVRCSLFTIHYSLFTVYCSMTAECSVLIVDDSAEDRVTYRHFLEQDRQYPYRSYTYRVLEAASVREALELSQHNRIDLILLALPETGMLEDLKRLGREYLVVATIDRENEALSLEAMQHGARDYLVKQRITEELLVRTVAWAMERLAPERQQQPCPQTEGVLGEKEERLSDILDRAGVAIVSFRFFADRTWEYDYYSAGCEAVFGFTPAEMMTGLWWQQILPEDRQSVIIPAQDRIFAEETVGMEYRFRHKDGTLRWISTILTSRRDEAADCWRVIAVDTDISDRKQAEQQIAFQASLLDICRNAVIATDIEGKIVYWNQFARDLYQLSPEQMGASIVDVVVPRGSEEIARAILAEIQAKGCLEGESIVQRQDGSTFPAYIVTTLIHDANGNPCGMVGVSMDISDRKRAEEALRQSEEQLRLVLDLNNIGCWDWHITTGKLLWNENHFRLYGLVPGEVELSYEVWRNALHPEDVERVEQVALYAVERKTDYYRAEYRVVRPDGSIHWMAGMGRCLYDDAGQAVRMLGVAIDISDRKAAEIALEQQARRDKALNRVLQSLHHSFDLAAIFTTAATEIGQLLQVSQVGIIQYLPERQIWLSVAEYRGKPEFPVGLDLEIPDEGNLIAAQLKQGTIVCINDTDRCEDEINRELAQTYPGAWLVIPLQCGSTTWGALSLHHCGHPWNWQESEVELAGAVADRLAIAIQQTNLFQQVQLELKERQQAEAALQQLNQELELRVQERTAQLQLALSSARMGYWEWNLVTNVKYWSPEVYALLGLQTDERGSVLDENGVEIGSVPTHELLQSHLHLEDREQFERAHQQALEKRSHYECEFRVVWRDGTVHWCYERGACVRNEQGQPVKLTGIRMDISDRKQAEKALRQSETRFQRLAAHVPGLIYQYILHAEGSDEFSYISPGCRELYELEPEAIQEDSSLVWATGHPEDMEAFRQSVMTSIQTLTRWKHEWRIITSSGKIKWLSGAAQPEKQANGDIIWDGLIWDISDRKRAEVQLLASLREKEVLLKEIHHRVKNNLQLVSSLLNLQIGMIQDPKILEPFQESQGRVQVMALIHEQLYQSENLARINFANYVRHLAANLFQSALPTVAAIDLRVEVADLELEPDVAIPCGLIINELVSNAIKYAFPNDRPGKIGIFFSADGRDRYRLVVRDNGVGIPVDLNIYKTQSLGLQIVCALTEQLAGTLELDRHKGAVFEIDFPQKRE